MPNLNGRGRLVASAATVRHSEGHVPDSSGTCPELVMLCGRYRTRTCDPYRVEVVQASQ